MKKSMLALTLTALMTVMAACSGTSGGPSAGGESSNNGSSNQGVTNTKQPAEGGEASDDQVELRVMWWGDQARADRTNEALKIFMEKNPDIKVIGEFAPSSGYFDKLNTQLASGTAPDVFFLGGNVVDYAKKGVLLDLSPYIDKELNLKDMDKAMIEYGTLDGKLQHISAGANARGILINTTMFEKAGIPVPQDGWTWDDYAAISKQISDKLGKGFYGTYNFTVDGFDIYLKQNGKQLYDMANNQLGFAEADIRPWFDYWQKTSEAGGVVTPELQVSNPPTDTGKSLLLTGKVAMTLAASNQLTAMQGLTQDKLTLVQVPRGPKGTGVVFESSQGMSGYAKTEHPAEAARLMSFWINDPDAAKILGNDRGVPVTAANRTLLEGEANEIDSLIYDYTSRVSKQAETEPFAVSYNLPGFSEFSKLAETTVQEIGFGRKKVEQAVTDFYSGTVKIFDSNK
ncbi:carbohydrate ABC transporter substrate-binding protein (CUT1 family) [Paenibacillus sp. BK033]|uniref:ABC transporter substrate-binding protein n=1 Tax=Paenibacillus sp. BK033 TaxID=2512133 RepID=UPI001050B69D|nr:extracellular solute-binding protein [Paenibacillus sp. BK033]TCN01433.1 carbohydrate ABC transporter substrate-binding protein (CUT1 family) [Paenibacillus sp. BK033]